MGELVLWAALCWEELSMEEEVTHVDADEDVRLMMARLTPDSLGLEATTDVTVAKEIEMLQERMSLAPDSLVLRTCLVVATTVAAIVEVIIHKITILRITILKTIILKITILKTIILRTIIPHLQDSPSRGVSVTTISPSETGMDIHGACRRADNTGRTWCYTNGGCADGQPSSRFPNNPWSYQACNNYGK